MVFMYFSIMVFKMRDLFELIANIENRFDGKKIYLNFINVYLIDRIILEIENPAAKAIFCRTNQLVEKCTQIICLVVSKLTPIFWVTAQITGCIFVYFFTDLGNDAFDLPIGMW